MVMMAEPVEKALQAVKQQEGGFVGRPVIYFSPTGQMLNQDMVKTLARGQGAVLLCGRYEGLDQRVIDRFVTHEISLGDFVLSGGELPALAMLDAVARLQEGVLGDARSHQEDSFSQGLLDCPHYSRPECLKGEQGQPDRRVPEVLLSGNHEAIARWRREQALALTQARRPDLLEKARQQGCLSLLDERFLSGPDS